MPRFTLDRSRAVITGASSGLGAEFARQLAPRAEALALVARRADALEALRNELLALNPRLRCECIVADLATEQGVAHTAAQLTGLALQPNVLINNAGMGDYGPFAEASFDKVRAQIDLNITSLLQLTQALIPSLRTQAPSGILNVSSLAASVPMPDVAVYAASKAFVTSFTEALRVELAGQGIVVTALCPGPTPTNFSRTAKREGGGDTDRRGQGLLRVQPQEVVRAGLEALERNAASVHPGFPVRVAASLFQVMPRALMRWVLARRYQQ